MAWVSARNRICRRPGLFVSHVVEHALDLATLQPVLAAAEVAGDDRVAHGAGEAVAVGLGDVGERAEDVDVALVVQELGRHRRELAAEEEVQEEGLDDVALVVAEDDGGAALLAGDAVEVAAAEARAERAVGAALGDLVGDDGIGVAVLDAVRHAHAGEELGEHGGREAGLALVEVAGEEVDRQQAAPFELGEGGEQRVAVLAAGEADEPAAACARSMP